MRVYVYVPASVERAVNAIVQQAPLHARLVYRNLVQQRIETALSLPGRSKDVPRIAPLPEEPPLRVAHVAMGDAEGEDVYVFFTMLPPEAFDARRYDLGRLVVAVLTEDQLEDYVSSNGLEFGI